jgi:hypothetical protein
MRKYWFALGLILLLVSFIFYFASGLPVYVESYVLKSKVTQNYVSGTLKTKVSAYFEVGEHFFFNFSRGRYWTGPEEVYEPSETHVDFAIPPHKKVTFDVHTPSNMFEVEVWMVEGQDPYVVLYLNKSDDFTPLRGGNLTVPSSNVVGIEGIINRNGTYTVEVVAVVPPIYKTETEVLDINEDPPITMNLYSVRKVETKPYEVLLPSSFVVAFSGVTLSVWAAKSGRKRRKVARKRVSVR